MTGGRFAAEERDWNPSVKSGWFAMAAALPRTRLLYPSDAADD